MIIIIEWNRFNIFITYNIKLPSACTSQRKYIYYEYSYDLKTLINNTLTYCTVAAAETLDAYADDTQT